MKTILKIVLIIGVGGPFFVTGSYSQEIEFVDVKPEVNVENSLYALVYLKYFPGIFAYSLPNEYKTFIMSPFEFNNSLVCVEFFQARDGIAQEQKKAYFNFLNNEKSYADLAKNAVYSFYREIRTRLAGSIFQETYSAGELDELYPQVLIGNELKDKVRLYSIIILKPRDGVSTIVLEFAWTIEQESGLFIHFRDNKVVKVSDSYDD